MKNQCLALLFLGLLACALAQDSSSNTVTVTKAETTVPTTQIVGTTATTGTVAQPVLTLQTSSASSLSPFWML